MLSDSGASRSRVKTYIPLRVETGIRMSAGAIGSVMPLVESDASCLGSRVSAS